MKTLLFKNVTEEDQVLKVLEVRGRRIHDLFIKPQHVAEIDILQVSPLTVAAVVKGLFEVRDESGETVLFGVQPEVEEEVTPAEEETPSEVVPDLVETPLVEEKNLDEKPEEDSPQEVTEQQEEKQPDKEEFVCEECGAGFSSKRALSSHKRSHN